VLTGRPPFGEKDTAGTESDFEVKTSHVTEVVPALEKLNSGIPAWLAKLVMSMLEKEPGQRPSSCEVIVEKLKAGDNLEEAQKEKTSGESSDARIEQEYREGQKNSLQEEATAEEKKLEGLGGWLIVVGIGIIISPFRIVTQVFSVYPEIFSNGSWAALTTPGTEAYNPLWAPIICGEMVINGGLVLASIFSAFLFFSKKKIFPKWYIGTSIFSLAFVVVDALVVKSVMPDVPLFDAETTKEFGRSLIAALVWVPYMLVSKRVKITFVR
jgi:serine/threonine protein kinase